MKDRIIYDSTYNDHSILTNQASNQGCYQSILDTNEKVFNQATANHSKLLYMRMDVRFPKDTHYPDESIKFKNFMNSFNRYLDRKGLDPHYAWCKERSREKHTHMHTYFLLDGQKTKSITPHMDKAEELWNKQLGLDPSSNNGLIDRCTKSRNGQPQHNGIMIRKDQPDYQDKINHCLEWSSYLAKVNTKSIPKHMNTFGHSKIEQDK